MPIINRDKEYTILPNLDELQECDECGVKQLGHNMWFSYPPGNQPWRILCMQCLYTPPNTVSTQTGAIAPVKSNE